MQIITKKSKKMVKISDLKEHRMNPKVYANTNKDLEDLKKSIEKYGILTSIVVNSNNVILSGHRRHKALVELKREDEEIEVEVINTKNEIEEVYFLLHHNIQRHKSTSEVCNEIIMWNKLITAEPGKRNDLDDFKNFDFGSSQKRAKIAKQLNIKENMVQRLTKIYDKCPIYLEKIDNGEMSIHEVYQIACRTGLSPDQWARIEVRKQAAEERRKVACPECNHVFLPAKKGKKVEPVVPVPSEEDDLEDEYKNL